MPNKLPKFLDNHKICIICEGNEEYEYLNRLKNLKVWNEQYDISLVNASGNGNIPARYQDRYQNGADELVLVFCDTEKKPHEQYEDIKRKINVFHGDEKPDEKVLDIPENIMDQIRLVSTYKGVHVPSMMFDSTGTKKIAAIASYVIEALEQGRILVVDELDSSIHFKLTRAIVAMFNNELNTSATDDIYSS